MGQRFRQLKQWLAEVLTEQPGFNADSWEVEAVSGDASFRRYFRAISGENSWIAVDAPPDKEDSAPFISVAQALEPLGVNVPHIYCTDLQQGFMLLGDLGDDLYLDALDPQTVEQLYSEAMAELVKIQPCMLAVPEYNEALLKREVELFREWFLQKLLGLELGAEDHQYLDQLFTLLIHSALQQPQVFVHRDYHSRNLMICPGKPPGVIDFQDAVRGPVTYDLVSLLRDCYIAWPDEQVYRWVAAFYEQLASEERGGDLAQFEIWFDLMGAQRHLKAIGIFARLMIRDAKPGYLPDIPRTFAYLLKVAEKYDESRTVAAWLKQRVVPAMIESPHFETDELLQWIQQ